MTTKIILNLTKNHKMDEQNERQQNKLYKFKIRQCSIIQKTKWEWGMGMLLSNSFSMPVGKSNTWALWNVHFSSTSIQIANNISNTLIFIFNPNTTFHLLDLSEIFPFAAYCCSACLHAIHILLFPDAPVSPLLYPHPSIHKGELNSYYLRPLTPLSPLAPCAALSLHCPSFRRPIPSLALPP